MKDSRLPIPRIASGRSSLRWIRAVESAAIVVCQRAMQIWWSSLQLVHLAARSWGLHAFSCLYVAVPLRNSKRSVRRPTGGPWCGKKLYPSIEQTSGWLIFCSVYSTSSQQQHVPSSAPCVKRNLRHGTDGSRLWSIWNRSNSAGAYYSILLTATDVRAGLPVCGR